MQYPMNSFQVNKNCQSSKLKGWQGRWFRVCVMLFSREICFDCKPNLSSDVLLSYVKRYINILFRIFRQKYFVFFIFLIVFFSLQVKHNLPRTIIFEDFVWKRLFSEIIWSLHETKSDALEENPSDWWYIYATYKQFIWFVFKRPGKRKPLEKKNLKRIQSLPFFLLV